MDVRNCIAEKITEKQNGAFTFKPKNDWFREIRISKKRFGKIIRNEQQPTLDELARLADFLGVSISSLYRSG